MVTANEQSDQSGEGPPGPPRLVLTLFVAGASTASLRARRQLEAWMSGEGGHGVQLAVVDVLERPDLAEAEQVLATPTLVRHAPPPRRKIIGDLSEWDRVALSLDVEDGAR